MMVCMCQVNFCSGFPRNRFHICSAGFQQQWELEKADGTAALLVLPQAGNKHTAAEDKTFTLLFRQRRFLRLLSAYICIDPFSYAKRSHSLCLPTLHHGCICHLAHRDFFFLLRIHIGIYHIFFKLRQLNFIILWRNPFITYNHSTTFLTRIKFKVKRIKLFSIHLFLIVNEKSSLIIAAYFTHSHIGFWTNNQKIALKRQHLLRSSWASSALSWCGKYCHSGVQFLFHLCQKERVPEGVLCRLWWWVPWNPAPHGDQMAVTQPRNHPPAAAPLKLYFISIGDDCPPHLQAVLRLKGDPAGGWPCGGVPPLP